MKVSIHQPMYMPWGPYITKLMYSDIFVVMDNVQMPGGHSFTNRNYIVQGKKPNMLTIPLQKHSLQTPIKSILISMDHPWYKKHQRAIALGYAFAKSDPLYETVLSCYEPENIPIDFTSFCVRQLEAIVSRLQLNTKIIRASELPISGLNGLDLIITILHHLGAKTYISGTGQGSLRYVDPQVFKDANIELKTIEIFEMFNCYFHAIPRDVAFIDMLFQLGDETHDYVFRNSQLVEFPNVATL